MTLHELSFPACTGTIKARFVYEGGLYGEWAGIAQEASLFPNAAHKVICVEFIVQGPDGNLMSTVRKSRRSRGWAAPRIPNGTGEHS
jgi:hypothetical protein